MGQNLEWNKASGCYEAMVDGKLVQVSQDQFSQEFDKRTQDPRDDEYRVWGVLTWLSSWDFSGTVPKCILK
jgi:hypothetical protein